MDAAAAYLRIRAALRYTRSLVRYAGCGRRLRSCRLRICGWLASWLAGLYRQVGSWLVPASQQPQTAVCSIQCSRAKPRCHPTREAKARLGTSVVRRAVVRRAVVRLASTPFARLGDLI